MLNQVSAYGRCVVSTGGGAVLLRTNWGHLRNGVVLYLEAPPEALAARVAAEGVAARPLLAGAPPGQETEHAARLLGELLAARQTMYAQADETVGAGDVGPAAVAERALAALAARLAADETQKRLRTVPATDSVRLEGGRGEQRI